MQIVRLSPFQFINLEQITRVEIYQTEETQYCTVHFTDGESYRCTEEETAALLPMIEKRTEEKADMKLAQPDKSLFS